MIKILSAAVALATSTISAQAGDYHHRKHYGHHYGAHQQHGGHIVYRSVTEAKTVYRPVTHMVAQTVYRPVTSLQAQTVYVQRQQAYVARPIVENYVTHHQVQRQVVQTVTENVPVTRSRVVGYNYQEAGYSHGYAQQGYGHQGHGYQGRARRGYSHH